MLKIVAEQIKPDCCHTPAVVSVLLTPLPVSCPLTTPLHYTKTKQKQIQKSQRYEAKSLHLIYTAYNHTVSNKSAVFIHDI